MLRKFAKALFDARRWIVSGAFLLTVGWVVETSQPFQACVNEKYHQAATQNLKNSISELFIMLGVYRDCSGHFAHDNAEAIIAAFTIILAFSTIFLWAATSDLVRSGEKTAERQLRAFIYAKGFQLGYNMQDDVLTGYLIFIQYENVGLTPATEIRNWLRFDARPMNVNWEPNFGPLNISIPAPLGPKGVAQSGYIFIPVETMVEKWRNETEIYVWSRVEYRDIFDLTIRHHHEQCAMVNLIHDPTTVPPRDHPPYVQFTIYGSQNTTS